VSHPKKLSVTGLGEVPRVYHEAWAAYEALRRLGFVDDEIVALICPGLDAAGTAHEELFHIVLRAQGREFSYSVAPIDRGFKAAQEYWYRLREAISSGAIPERELLSLWRTSEMGANLEHFTTLATLLTMKGFFIPAAAN
jgi:hypothetical protein